jgi:hypothetical protein
MSLKKTAREKWFYDRIGKKIFGNSKINKNGFLIASDLHADYLFMVEMDSEGTIKYFDTPEERNEFEKA